MSDNLRELIAKWRDEAASFDADAMFRTGKAKDDCADELEAALSDPAPVEPTCPFVVTSREGTSYCRLAEQNGAKPAEQAATDFNLFTSPMAEQAKAEPVAWIAVEDIENLASLEKHQLISIVLSPVKRWEMKPLYATPQPAVTWEQAVAEWRRMNVGDTQTHAMIDWIERRAKELAAAREDASP